MENKIIENSLANISLDNKDNAAEKNDTKFEKLLEIQKMQALNFLLSGISHTMNTPIGISVTAVSFLESELQGLQENLQLRLFDKNSINKTLDNISKSLKMVKVNLNKTVGFINHLKLTNIYYKPEELIYFNLSDHIRTIIKYLDSRDEVIKDNHLILTEIPEDIYIHSFPTAFNEILINLFDNSIIHGFDGLSGGFIKVNLVEKPHHFLLKYSDSGHGISADLNRRIFEPFFTTKMGQGSNGLGLNIVYNLVVHNLNGQIDCYCKPGRGLEILIQIDK